MSDVRCPSCGDSFRVPDFAVPASATAKCPWCGDSFRLSTLVAHLPPLAELLGEDGTPISLADLAQASVQASAPLALVGAAGIAEAGNSDAEDFDVENLVDQPLGSCEVANDVREFAEEGVPFAEAGLPESTDETTEWNLDSPLAQTSVSADEAPIEVGLAESQDADDWVDVASQDDNFESEFGSQCGSPPRPLAEVTDFGLGREERMFVPRPRSKRQAAPLKSIIGIVIGGLLAFPLAAGILALAGKPLNLGFWPFDGETISMNSSTRRSAATPLDLAPRVANNDNRGGRSLADDMPSLDVDPPSLDVDPPSLADDMPSLDVDPPSLADSPGDVAGGFSAPPATDAADDLDNLLAANSLPVRNLADIAPPAFELPPLDLPAPTLAADEPEMAAEITDPNPADAVADPVVTQQEVEEIAPMPAAAVVDEPDATAPLMTLPTVSPELQSAMEEASAAMGDVVNNDDSEGIRRRLATLFEKVAAVGSIASTDDEAAVGSLVQRLVDSDLVATLSPAAPNWARYSRRPNNGMLATGILRREDDQWMLDWTGPAPLEVRFSDESIAQEGASVIILGTIEQTEPSTIVEVRYLQQQ